MNNVVIERSTKEKVEEAIILSNMTFLKWFDKAPHRDIYVNADDVRSVLLTFLRRKLSIEPKHFSRFSKLILSVNRDPKTKSILTITLGCYTDENFPYYINEIYRILDSLDFSSLVGRSKENYDNMIREYPIEDYDIASLNFREIQNINF